MINDATHVEYEEATSATTMIDIVNPGRIAHGEEWLIVREVTGR
jgi:hypothetical protein